MTHHRIWLHGRVEDWRRRLAADETLREEVKDVAERAESVAERIKTLRKLANLRQRDLVRHLDLPQDKVSRWENAHQTPCADDAEALGELFGIPPELFGNEV